MTRQVRIPGFRLKDGRLIRDERRLSVSERLKRRSGIRVRVARPGAVVPSLGKRP